MSTRNLIGVLAAGASALAMAAPAMATPPKLTLTIPNASTKANTSPITSYAFGVSNVRSAANSGGGGAGKASFADFTVQKPVDGNTPSFINHATSGSPFDGIVAIGFSGAINVAFCLKNAFVTSDRQTANDGDNTPNETVTFAFSAITEKVGANLTSFDVAKNQPGTALC